MPSKPKPPPPVPSEAKQQDLALKIALLGTYSLFACRKVPPITTKRGMLIAEALFEYRERLKETRAKVSKSFKRPGDHASHYIKAMKLAGTDYEALWIAFGILPICQEHFDRW